ncbi:MAG: ATP-binding protein [Candidatus Hodarchaeales archaeon]|jgi:PAS domain S-box-containing protein
MHNPEVTFQEENIFDFISNPAFLFTVNNKNQIFLFRVNSAGLKVFGSEIMKFKEDFPEFLNSFSPTIVLDIVKIIHGKEIPSKHITWNKGNEYPSIVQNNSHFLVDFAKVNDNMVLMSLKDITDIIQQQDAVKESLDLNFGLHAEVSPLGIMVLDSEGTIIFANPTSTKLLGWIDGKTTLVEGRNIFNLSIIKNKQEIVVGIEKLLKGQPLVEDELRINSGSNVKVMKLYGSPRFTAVDTLEGAILTWADVTDLVHAQTNLKHQKNELSELASIMRHDLMNYLHNIMGYAEILELKTQDEYRDFSKKIRNNALHIQKVLNRSFELAEAGKIIEKKEEVDLGEVVDEIVKMTIPDTVEFSKNTLPILCCDKDKVTQIFQNLFKNAVIHANPSIIKMEFSNQNNIEDRISVINDGTLVPEEIQEKVFDRGFTTSKEGSGLGLYITKKLCNAHQWEIFLEVTDVTMFHIVIPKNSPEPLSS